MSTGWVCGCVGGWCEPITTDRARLTWVALRATSKLQGFKALAAAAVAVAAAVVAAAAPELLANKEGQATRTSILLLA